jgi:hypothetical protein
MQRLLRPKALLATAFAVAFSVLTAAAFSAYLKPGMLIEFANLMLCV